MPGTFHGIGMTSNALRMFQRALDVTGHNVSNVNTPGFSRQTVEFADTDPTLFYSGGTHTLGNGVTISSVNRIRDAFLDARRLSSEGDTGRLGTMSDGLQRVQSLFLEPGGSGISDALDKFFNSWSALSANPNEPGARVAVQQSGVNLASRVRNTYLDLQSQLQGAQQSITDTLSQVQTLSNKIADLNAEIKQKVALGAEPNDLLDMRDNAVRELGQLVDINTTAAPDGTVAVRMNQFTLVDSSGAKTVPTTFDATTSQLSDGSWTYDVRGGQLRGLFETVQKIKGYQANLDSLANSLRTEVNAVHRSGINPLGATGVNFFGDVTPPTPQTGAIDFDVDAAVKANPDAIVSSVTGTAGDGGLALSVSRMRDSSITGLGGKTFSRYFTEMVTDIGRTASELDTAKATQDAVNQQIDQQIQSVSGVSIDDEMANMLRFQRSYQAAARALSVFDQVTEDVINLIR